MSRLDRNKLKKMIIQEMKMLDMVPMDSMGMMGGARMGGEDHGHEMEMPMHHSAAPGKVSREDCCAAVMCMVECCSCPVTKAALMECCADIMAGDYDH